MSDYHVNLEIFAGPLDLLLYLIKKEEVDIYDIPIAKITDQYLSYIKMLRDLDIDVAGDFMVMAATLMQMKSAMLLPKVVPDDEQEDMEDPRTQLIHQLLEYKKFKDAANQLDAAAEEQAQKFTRPNVIVEQLKGQQAQETELDMDQVSVWDLLDAFDSIMSATGQHYDISHIKDDTPIDLYQMEILHTLQQEGPMTFKRIFATAENRPQMVGLFLALLELIRDGLAWVEQPESKESIFVKPLTDEPAEQAVKSAIMQTEEQPYQHSESDKQSNHSEEPEIPIDEIPSSKSRENSPSPNQGVYSEQ